MREELTQFALNIACFTFREFKVDTTPLHLLGEDSWKLTRICFLGVSSGVQDRLRWQQSTWKECALPELEQVTKETEAALSGIRAMNQKEKVAREQARTAKTEERRGRRLTRPSRVRRQPPCCPSSSTIRALSSPTWSRRSQCGRRWSRVSRPRWSIRTRHLRHYQEAGDPQDHCNCTRLQRGGGRGGRGDDRWVWGTGGQTEIWDRGAESGRGHLLRHLQPGAHCVRGQ